MDATKDERQRRDVDAGDVEPRELRTVMATFATGVTVVTLPPADDPHGITVNAFTSVSLDPPFVLVCLDHGTRTYERIDRGATTEFCVNVLAEAQRPLAEHFAGMTEVDDPFAGATTATTGAPVLHESLAHLDCSIHETIPAGDHSIVVARVLDAAVADESARPLTFYRGDWGTIEPPAASPVDGDG